jgi:hypothetical protein
VSRATWSRRPGHAAVRQTSATVGLRGSGRDGALGRDIGAVWFRCSHTPVRNKRGNENLDFG